MNEPLIQQCKERADKYCRDNSSKLSPYRYQEHIENAILLGASMVLEQQQEKRMEAMCGLVKSKREEEDELS